MSNKNVVVLKMVDGSELLATFDGEFYEKIRIFHLTQQGAGLVPWIMCSPDAKIRIRDESIVAFVDAPAEIEKQYLAATSNIQLLS